MITITAHHREPPDDMSNVLARPLPVSLRPACVTPTIPSDDTVPALEYRKRASVLVEYYHLRNVRSPMIGAEEIASTVFLQPVQPSTQR